MKWLEILRKNSVPYLVCLTHADKLYANHVMSKIGIDYEYSEAQRTIGLELQVTKYLIFITGYNL